MGKISLEYLILIDDSIILSNFMSEAMNMAK